MPSSSRSNPGSGSGASRYPGTFLLAFREAAGQLGLQARRWLGDLAECVDADGKEHHIGLENLYRRARRSERETWPALIREFLTTVLAAEQEENLPDELAGVADKILVRLGQPLRAMTEDAKVWSRPLDDTGLFLNLVIDYPDRMCYVTAQLVEASGQPGSHWLEQAVTNLRARTQAEAFQVIHEESGMLLCDVADAYDSSRALLLDGLLPQSRDLGCFVALPGRDELLVLQVSTLALAHLHLLKILAEKNFRGAPYPISDEVYWVHQGVWRLFPMAIGAQEVTVKPPAEFVDILKRLDPDGLQEAPEQPPETP